MQAFIDQLLHFVSANSGLAGFILFLIAFAETLVVFGLFVPGTAIMVATGVMVAHDSISFALACGTMIAGGIAGDAVSYWLGRRYGPRILTHRLFVKRTRSLERARALTVRHSAKAVLIARFVGQIRPLVPFLAGVAGMPPRRFMIFNALGAAVATPLHLIPGIAIGLGLQFTAAIAIRAVVLLVLIGLAIWLSRLLTRFVVRGLNAIGPQASDQLRIWADARRVASNFGVRFLARIVAPLLDSTWRKITFQLALGVGALACLAGIAEIVEQVMAPSPLTAANEGLLAFFQGLHTPWSDHVMVAVASLGGMYSLLALVGAVLAGLIALRAHREALLWSLACGFGFASALAIRWVGRGYGSAISENHVFPNGHTATSVIVFGYLGFLIAASSPKAHWQAAVGFAVFALISLISIAQLYWGIVYVTDLIGGLLLGIFWLTLLFIAGPRTDKPRSRGRLPLLSAVASITLVITVVVQVSVQHDTDLARLRRPSVQITIPASQWLVDGWRNLPSYRRDAVGEVEEPINLQVAGSSDDVSAAFLRVSWMAAPAWNLQSAFALISGSEDPARVSRPVLPRLWNGRSESLVFVRGSDDGRVIVRLWDLDYRLGPTNTPLYLGTVEREIFGRAAFYDLVVLPPHAGDFSGAVHIIAEEFGPSSLRSRGTYWQPMESEGEPVAWNGATMVLDLISASRAVTRTDVQRALGREIDVRGVDHSDRGAALTISTTKRQRPDNDAESSHANMP